jgi:signal transduction histidine kinase
VQNKRQISIIIIALVVGLLLGYGIWGKKKEERLDAQQLLNMALKEVTLIQKENAALKKKIEGTREIDKKIKEISQEKENLEKKLEKAEQDKKQLESVIARLRSESVNTQKEKADEKLKAQIAILQEEKRC